MNTQISPDEKRCRECGQPMFLAARLCAECKSFQDWRRYIPFSTTVLALLTALVSVIGATAPALVKALETPDSNLSVMFQGDDRMGGLQFVITNTGARAGGIRSVYLTLSINNEQKVYEGWFDRTSAIVAQPGSATVARYTFENKDLSKYTLLDIDNGKCFFKVRTRGFSGKIEDHNFEEICDSIPTAVPLYRP